MTRTSLQSVLTHRHDAFGCEDAATVDCADCIWDEMPGSAASSLGSFHTSAVERHIG
jgi:hypothetical protein